MNAGTTRAMELGIVACHDCGKLAKLETHHQHCERCGGALHFRKTDSLARSWALLIASAIFYIPANVMPITRTASLGTASVAVPFLKIVVLTFLLIAAQRQSTWRPLDRTKLYRITELVGRWSMVDVFVVTILVALVQLGILATIQAGPGALYFGMVVVLTMLAAQSFDPRLIWDPVEENND